MKRELAILINFRGMMYINMSHIVFLLPGHGLKPIGGHKVVYEYANRFIDQGNEVSIIYGASCLFNKMSLQKKSFAVFRYLYFKFSKKYLPYSWFDLNRKISIYYSWDLSEKHIKGDIVFATSMETAIISNQYKTIDKKNIYYLIQDFEYWHWGKELATQTWHFNFTKIVISPWFQELGNQLGVKTTLIENGFDFEKFYVDLPVEKKDKFSVIMLYHKLESKGSSDGIKALNIVKERIPQLKVILFGTSKRPENLPDWYKYYQLPNKETLKNIYNQSAVYVGTSHTEGWGLTIGEAMQCGCAVACTNNDGYLIMAEHNETALVSSIKDPEALSENIVKLVENDDLRFNLAKNGNLNIQKYTWEKSFQKINELIKK